MLNHLKSEANIAYTENGAVTNASTMSDCLNLFAVIGALRAADDQEIIRRFVRAYAEDADIAMKILFFGRDVRGGLGERRVFRVIINWLAENRAESLRKNIELIPEFGRYDDLVSLIGTACEKDALRTIRKQLEADLASDAEVSLLAKWLPSVNASNAETVRKAKRIARYWTAFSYTPWIILPVVLGMLCTMLMYNENQYDMLKQLWIVPVNKMAYFFSKFAVVLVYSICFMLVTATASILTGILSGYIPFDSESVLYLLRKCMEISLLTAFAVLPVLAVAAAQKGYILPVCLTLIYTFLGFILLMVNMYLHPLSSMTAIVMYDIPGVVFDQPLNIPAAFLCIGVWAAASAVLANVALVRRK